MEPIERREFLKTALAAGLTTVTSPLLMGATPTFPSPYGRIIYQKDTDAPNQIYIVGQVHKAPSGKNHDPLTPRIQREIFRLGEYLIKNDNLGLLIDEGVPLGYRPEIIKENLLRARKKLEAEAGKQVIANLKTASDDTLERILGNNNHRSNAQILLTLAYGAPLRGAEDRSAYQRIGKLLREIPLFEKAYGKKAAKPLWDEVRYLQDIRSAAVLFFTPWVINHEMKRGAITTRKAYVPFGLSHIDEMMEFADTDTISIPAVPGYQSIKRPLGLKEKKCGVTFIIPTTVKDRHYKQAEDRGFLRCLPESDIKNLKTTKPCVSKSS